MVLVYDAHDIVPPEVAFPDARIPTDLEEYLFDLQGFVLLRGAAELVDHTMWPGIDTFPLRTIMSTVHKYCRCKHTPRCAHQRRPTVLT